MTAARRLLFLSNGHGEDSLAVKVLDRLRGDPGLEIAAWPMVGEGAAYRVRGVAIVGAPNRLPGCGLSLITWRYFWNDLRAGWIRTHWRQYRAARRLSGRFDLALVVGDIVPIAAAWLARLPFFLVGCAKSSYYHSIHRYTALETRLLRRHCRRVFPRDRLTQVELERGGVRARYVGNPMMDDLTPSGVDFGLPADARVVVLLPGSRSDTLDNLRDLLEMAPAVARACGGRTCFLVAAHDGLDCTPLTGRPPDGWTPAPRQPGDDSRGICLRLLGKDNLPALLARGRFADAILRADVVVGVAGTANEQAVGLGRPLVTFPTRGYLGRTYVNMKAHYFGPAALTVERNAQAVAGAVQRILGDARLRETMVAAGRERMGEPGASQAIADEVRRALQELEAKT